MPTNTAERSNVLHKLWTKSTPILEQKKKDGNKIPVQQFESNYNMANFLMRRDSRKDMHELY
jgi:hypothetical protein